MLAKCYSGTVVGANAMTIEIEVSSGLGTSQFAIVGLPDQAVKEAKDRIPTALRSQGLRPNRELDVTVNLAPADVKKEGPIYDLPIALALLKATGRVNVASLEEFAAVGELSLSGEIRSVRGVLPVVMEMRRIGRRAVLVPYENGLEASVVKGIDVIPVRTLQEAVCFLNGERKIDPLVTDMEKILAEDHTEGDDFSEVKGQFFARKAVEVAVAGGHNLLMIGSPGSGKSMIARRIPSILPALSPEESLEVSKIHSVAGIGKGFKSFLTRRPFRSPHHTVSAIGLLGGGAHAVPGEVSLAHNGVLFLDEFAEFPRSALEVLRQPMEDGEVNVSRAVASVTYPSKFMLVAAMNPCPCGWWGDEHHACRCSSRAIVNYQSRVSGPLLDRIDIQIEVPAVNSKDIPMLPKGESSAAIRERVMAARAVQAERYRDFPNIRTNSEVRSTLLDDVCKFTMKDKRDLVGMIERLNLSARAYDKVLRVARTLADLAGVDAVRPIDLQGALSYRRLDDEEKSFWL